MKAHPEGDHGAPENPGDLLGSQVFPRHEPEHLTVGLSKRAKRPAPLITI